MSNKLLTIIIPVYRTEQYLRKCLDSLIIPTCFESLEVIIIIDGSPDNSISIAREYETRFPTVFKIIDKENGGHGSCCNIGLKEAKGKYVRFLDSDDWLETETLEYLVKVLQYCDADIVFTKSIKELVYENRQEPYGISLPIAEKKINIAEIEIPFSIDNPYFFTLSDCQFNRIMLKKTGIEFSEGVPFDDTIIYLTPFLEAKNILIIDKILYHYLIGRPEQSVGNYSADKLCHMANEFLKCLSICKKLDGKLDHSSFIYVSQLCSLLIDKTFTLTFNCEASQRKALYYKLRKTIKSSEILNSVRASKYKTIVKLPHRIVLVFYTIKNYIR